MHEPDFWTASAEAMELTIEGNRLIANEIAQGVRTLWRRAMRSVDSLLHGQRQQQHLPPL